MDLHFIRNGGHIGAFGAMMNSVMKFSIKRDGDATSE